MHDGNASRHTFAPWKRKWRSCHSLDLPVPGILFDWRMDGNTVPVSFGDLDSTTTVEGLCYLSAIEMDLQFLGGDDLACGHRQYWLAYIHRLGGAELHLHLHGVLLLS